MDYWLVFLVMALATARLTRLVVEDQISEPIRNWAYRRDPKMRHLGYLVSCPYCTGIWASGVVLGLSVLGWDYWGTVGGCFAAGTVALLGLAQAALWLTPKAESAVTTSWRDI